MNVFGSSVAEETKKIIANLEISNKNIKDNIRSLEEIIKTVCKTYTKLEYTSELNNKINFIENRLNSTEKNLSEVVTHLHIKDSEVFKINTEVTAKEERRV